MICWKLLITCYPHDDRVKKISLPIDECEEWIWDILDCTRDCGFEYVLDDDKEFLICNTNNFFADIRAFLKSEKLREWSWCKLALTTAKHNCGFAGLIRIIEYIHFSFVT